MRIAVLGCGSIGRKHLHNMRALGDVEVVAYDPDASTRARIHEEFQREVMGELAAVWVQNPEAVVVAAPSDAHVALAMEAAERDLPFFIEKPLSHSMEGVDRLCHEVSQRNLITMVACNMRFHPGPATVKRWIDSGVAGDVLAMRIKTGSFLPRWRPTQDYRHSYSASSESGGATLDCIHELDLALWYGGPAVVIGAASLDARSIGLDTDGLIEILLRHESGALSNVHLNFLQRDYRRTCEIIGTEGTIRWDFNAHRVERFDADGALVETIVEPEGWSLNQMYVDELSHFIDAVRQKQPTVNPLSHAVQVLAAALEARNWGRRS